jgi:predicted phosphohydrolase
MSLEETAPDFKFVDALPGKKLILKGNHDYWWTTAAKTKRFFREQGITTIDILHNNAFTWGDYAICGTRGWFYEEEKGGEHDAKIMRREIMRLEASLKAAGERTKLVFLHYPPIYGNYRCEEILALHKEYRVPLCYYGHIHGKGCSWAFNGFNDGTQFKLVSADFVNFTPVRVPFAEE